MSEGPNGDQLNRSLKELFASLTEFDDSSLLRDLGQDYPALRLALVGGTADKAGMPALSVHLSRVPRGIRVCIRIELFQLEAHYEFQNWSEIWETLNNDIDLGTVPWQQSWQKRKQEQLKVLRGL